MNAQIFKTKAKELNVELTEHMIFQFETYYNFLVEYNQKVNLTAITEREDVYLKHFLDSIAAANLIKKSACVCDIGAGAGFPGVPLKIVRPDISLTMVDSLNKRIVFLQELIKMLGLSNTRAAHARAEDFVKQNREVFDCCVARAVSGLSTLSEYCLPFVKLGGLFIAYKASAAAQEVKVAKNAIKILGGVVEGVVSIDLPQSDIHRAFVVVKKAVRTPKEYPRDKNRPKTQPL